ncbi:MAG: TlyA family RNA methyltransferase [Opitutales bacterium]|nr:TlyA family RNA methyltransferase [Opitutales bacterium]
MKRADELLAELNLVESRSKARALIEEGKVKADAKIIDKPSRKISENAKIEIAGGADALKYVSRAGLKIEAFLDKFEIPCAGADIIDIGASTGGFTDCLLQRGAKSAVCVDVGTNQLHEKIKSDPRVKNLEKTDARSLTSEILGGMLFDILCADLSFISLEKVVPFVWQFIKKGGVAVLLVKPQFETPPALMRRTKGVIKDAEIQQIALEKIKKFFSENFADAEYIGEMKSPIKGGDGNVEFLLGLKKR